MRVTACSSRVAKPSLANSIQGKRVCMKRAVLSSVLTASLLVIAVVSFAYAGSSSTTTAKVPFAFSVGKVSLPAGEYTINELSSGLIRIQGDGSHQCFDLTNPGTSPGKDTSARLVFHRYDDQYFLSETYNGVDDAVRRFPISKLEKELMATGSNSVAENSRRPDVVVIALATR
jgi:hypothetical protein